MGDPVRDSRRLLGVGGSVGLGTLSPEIQQAADEGDPTLFAALWITDALELFLRVRRGRAYWYVRFWGPWFLLGGLLFMTAGWAYMRNSSNRRIAVGASVLGGLGGLAAVAAPLVVSALASPA